MSTKSQDFPLSSAEDPNLEMTDVRCHQKSHQGKRVLQI